MLILEYLKNTYIKDFITHVLSMIIFKVINLMIVN